MFAARLLPSLLRGLPLSSSCRPRPSDLRSRLFGPRTARVRMCAEYRPVRHPRLYVRPSAFHVKHENTEFSNEPNVENSTKAVERWAVTRQLRVIIER